MGIGEEEGFGGRVEYWGEKERDRGSPGECCHLALLRRTTGVTAGVHYPRAGHAAGASCLPGGFLPGEGCLLPRESSLPSTYPPPGA